MKMEGELKKIKITSAKVASKGGQKDRNVQELIIENYLKSLNDKTLIDGENMGFRYIDQTMKLYKCQKTLLTPIYVKRVVMDDGIHTHPLIMVATGL